MANKLPPIYFYIPQEDWPADGFPESADMYWQNFNGHLCGGVYASTVQTYLRLKAENITCELVGSLPDRGIVLAHRDSLPDNLQPGPNLFIVCLKLDRQAHPYAQMHVIVNTGDMNQNVLFFGEKYLFPGQKYYIPHWPQPGLIIRNSERGDRFENIAYIGNEENLAPDLRDSSWQEKLDALGLRWHLVDISRSHSWNDFSYVDAIVAVRNFQRRGSYKSKPALKLYNAWHAGVPAILGGDSGVRAERKSELDYIEVTSLNEIILALKRLRDDRELRRAMVANGKIRAEETKPEKLVKLWCHFLINVAVPAYEQWCIASNFKRQIFFLQGDLVKAGQSGKNTARSTISNIKSGFQKPALENKLLL